MRKNLYDRILKGKSKEQHLNTVLKSCPHIYIYIYRIQVTLSVILNNVTSLNNLLLNSYFKNPSIGLYICSICC